MRCFSPEPPLLASGFGNFPPARYGAFPSASTWYVQACARRRLRLPHRYVAAGAWPSTAETVLSDAEPLPKDPLWGNRARRRRRAQPLWLQRTGASRRRR